jgi:PAS domain S-box-containing protein
MKDSKNPVQLSDMKWASLMEATPDGVYIHDLQGHFIYGNKKAEEILGYSVEELRDKSFLKLGILPPEERAKAVKLLALSVAGRPTCFRPN